MSSSEREFSFVFGVFFQLYCKNDSLRSIQLFEFQHFQSAASMTRTVIESVAAAVITVNLSIVSQLSTVSVYMVQFTYYDIH